MSDKPISDLTDEELNEALVLNPLAQEKRRREKARSDEWDRKRREENERIEHELDVKYSAEAGVTIDRWQELKDVFTDWHYEWEKYFG